MSLQPIARFQGQATDIDLARKEVKNVKAELVRLTVNYVALVLHYYSPCILTTITYEVLAGGV